MSVKQLLAIIGACILGIGVFAPIVHVPAIGSLDLFHLEIKTGITVMVLALASLLLALFKQYNWLWFSAAASLGVVLLAFTNRQSFLTLEQLGMGVQLAWGWGMLMGGSYLIIASATFEKTLGDSRWKLNVFLMSLVLGLAICVYNLPEAEEPLQARYEISSYKMSDFNLIQIEMPAKAPLVLERMNDIWQMKAPYKAHADQGAVLKILAIVGANSEVKITHPDFKKYGVDHPEIRIVLIRPSGIREEFDIGQYNSVTELRYVSHRGNVYLLPEGYAEAAQVPPIELIDKTLFKPSEQIVGFDFSGLEQWRASKLKIKKVLRDWQFSIPNAHPKQAKIDDWVQYEWQDIQADKVQIHVPHPGEAPHPSVLVLLSNGQQVRLEKLQESPELLIARTDEGLVYHFGQDIGFSMLNPPLDLSPN